MANKKPEGDVTRKAVELASVKIAAAKAQLQKYLYTGPDTVMMTPAQIQEKISQGSTGLVPYAESADLDQALLMGQISGGQRGGTTRA
jgi:hypothetical protein